MEEDIEDESTDQLEETTIVLWDVLFGLSMAKEGKVEEEIQFQSDYCIRSKVHVSKQSFPSPSNSNAKPSHESLSNCKVPSLPKNMEKSYENNHNSFPMEYNFWKT